MCLLTGLVVEFPVGVGPKERVPDLGQHLLCDHAQSGLQGGVDLDAALHGVQLNAAGAGKCNRHDDFVILQLDLRTLLLLQYFPVITCASLTKALVKVER